MLHSRHLGSVLVLALSFAATGCTVETLVPGSADPESREAGETKAPADPSATAPTTPSAAPTGATPNEASSAEVSLRAEGDCAPEFRDLVVSTNVQAYDSLAVANATAPNDGSFQIQLVSAKRELTLSSKERTEGRDVINVMAGGVVYTNLCNGNGAGGCTFDPASKTWRNDPVTGTVAIKAYDPRKGTLDVTLEGVVLASTRGAGVCKLQGTVKATRLGR